MKNIPDLPSETLLTKVFCNKQKKSIISSNPQLDPIPIVGAEHARINVFRVPFIKGYPLEEEKNWIPLEWDMNGNDVVISLSDRSEGDIIAVKYKFKYKWRTLFYRIHRMTENEVVLEFKRHNYIFNSIANIKSALQYQRNEPSLSLF